MKALHHSVRELAVLQEATEMILASMDLDTVLHHILLIVRNYFGVGHSAVWLVDEHTQELYVRAKNGYEGVPDDIRLKLGEEGVIGHAAVSKAPIYVPDVSKEPRYLRNIANIKSEFALPLVIRDKVVGVLDLESDDLDYFTDDMIGLLALFAGQAAVALENARLHSTERRRMRQVEIINLIARASTSAGDLDELLTAFGELLNDTFEGSDVFVLLRAPDGRLEMRAHSGLSPDLPADFSLLEQSGIVQQAFGARMSAVVNDCRTREHWTPVIPGSGSELCVPLVSFSDILGGLVVCHSQQQYFSAEDRSIAQASADVCATAIRNVLLADELRRVSNTDHLTGVYNQRYFHVMLAQELSRGRRYGKAFSIGILDLNDFRAVNNRLGFEAGDAVLRGVADLVKRQMRVVDTVCRYSGDQFAVILPETNSKQVPNVLEKLQEQLASLTFVVPKEVPALQAVVAHASFPEDSATELEMVRMMLTRLNEAKAQAKGRKT